MTNWIFTWPLILLIYFKLVISTNYCDPDLCKKPYGSGFQYVNHLACRHDGRNAPNCPADAQILPMSVKRKNLILRMHNRLRNQVALGKLPGFPKAVRMPLVRWDDELAYLAELNVKQCIMNHDKCRNTDKFKYAGQNLAYRQGGKETNADRIKLMIRGWFDEYKYADESFIDRYRNHPQDRVIGHFTAMIQDRTDTIGCAIIRHSQNSYMLLACNYAFTNMMDQKVYTKGSVACSKCSTGCSKIYTGLCKAHEYVDPDPYEDLD